MQVIWGVAWCGGGVPLAASEVPPPPRHALRANAVLRVDVTTMSPPLTACETAVRRRTLQRRNCNDGVPAVAPILPHP